MCNNLKILKNTITCWGKAFLLLKRISSYIITLITVQSTIGILVSFEL